MNASAQRLNGNGRDERSHKPRVRLMPIEDMPSGGTLKWFDEAKGFGFIIADDRPQDVFLHVSVTRLYGLRPDVLVKGLRVRFAAEECVGRRPEATAIAIA